MIRHDDLPIVLASASPRRRAILSELGLAFEAREPQGVDESSVEGTAVEVSTALALAKARAVFARSPGSAIVIGCDTVVALPETSGAHALVETVLGKPRDDDDAREILRRLSGRVHHVVSGLAVVTPLAETVVSETSEVEFRELDERAIEAYIATGDHRGKAGAYGIQSEGRRLVAGFRGCYYNIVGLPWRRLAALLPAGIIAKRCDCGTHPLQRGERGCDRS
ncbi:MAG TPA: Maf family protein [Planctomycetota bacterium]|nr:Maf family protein [Planctomycetota bacterium]